MVKNTAQFNLVRFSYTKLTGLLVLFLSGRNNFPKILLAVQYLASLQVEMRIPLAEAFLPARGGVVRTRGCGAGELENWRTGEDRGAVCPAR